MQTKAAFEAVKIAFTVCQKKKAVTQPQKTPQHHGIQHRVMLSPTAMATMMMTAIAADGAISMSAMMTIMN